MTPGKDVSRAAVAAASLSGSGPLDLDDIADAGALLRRLRDPDDAVGTDLLARFSEAGRARVLAADPAEAPALQQTILDELNRLLGGETDLWSAALAGAPMRQEMRKRLQKPATAADRAWKNRFRLELALPHLVMRPINALERAGADLFAPADRPAYEQTIARRMGRLERSSLLDPETREHLWGPLLIGAHYAAVLEVQKAAVRRHLNWLAFGVAALVLVAMPLLAWTYGGKPPVAARDGLQILRYITIILITFVPFGLLAGFGSWLRTRFLVRQVDDIRVYVIVLVVWPILAMLYSTAWIRGLLATGTLPAVTEAAGLMAADALWLLFLAGLALHWASARGLQRWFEDEHAEVVVADGMLAALVLLEDGRDHAWSLDTRQGIAGELERVASCIERVLPRKFEGRAGADPWVAQSARELALGVRKLKRWVATPLTDTTQQLAVRLRSDLVYAAAGAWGHLERCPEDPADAATGHPVRQALAGGLRTLVIAALPLVAVWTGGVYGLGEPLRTQLLISAAAWAVLTILLDLDPNSSRQLAALRDALPHAKGKD